MRVYGNTPPKWSPVLIAALIFIVLIIVIRLVGGQQEQVLQQRFAAAPPDPNAGQIALPPVPTILANLARTATARILGGQATAPINRSDENGALRVQIDAIEPENGTLKITGQVTNISAATIDISLDAFKFIDETGTVYASSGNAAQPLQAGQAAPLSITLPIATPQQLKLNVEQPGQPTIELTLLNTVPTPTP